MSITKNGLLAAKNSISHLAIVKGVFHLHLITKRKATREIYSYTVMHQSVATLLRTGGKVTGNTNRIQNNNVALTTTVACLSLVT